MTRRALGPAAALLAGLGLLSGAGTGAEEPPKGETSVHSPMPVPVRPIPEPARVGVPAARQLQALAPPPPEAPAPLAPAMTSGFIALPDNNSSIPPDTHGAVGPNHLMVTLNTEVLVQDRSGTPILGSKQTLNNFWLSVDPFPGGAFDPRVHYDSLDDRWITVACDQARSADSAIFIGVSLDSSPVPTSTNWYRWRIDVDTGGLVWADYPSVGFNRRWIVVQVNMFNVSNNVFNRSHFYVFEKAQLYANNLVYQTISDGTIGGTQAPALTYDSSLDDIYLLQMVNPDFLGNGYLQLFTINGPDNAPVLVPGPYVTAPPWTDDAGGADFAPQLQTPGCGFCPAPPCKIQTNDSRIQNVVYRNGTLWASHTVHLPAGGSPTRSAIQWWQVDTSGSVLQRGLIDSGGPRHFAFPSIAVNKNDDVLVGYSSFQANQWASASYSFRTAIDPPNTMQSESPLKAGEACYYKIFSGSRNRWGDYSATAVDPTDDVKLWTLQEYAATPAVSGNPQELDRWGTWWGMLDPTPEVRIDDRAANEGDSGTTVFSFGVHLTDAAGNPLPTSQTVTVDWRTGDGTATTADADYAGVAADTLTFLPGQTDLTIDVIVNGDLKLEGNETFVVDLTGAGNATIADAQAVGTILNNDPVPQISIGDVTKVEGTGLSGTFTNFVFPVTLSNPRDTDVTVTRATANGSAVAGAYNVGDFVGPAPSVLILPAGSVAGSVTVQVHPDTLIEPAPDELFYVDLSSPGGATLLKSRGVGRIQDDDTANPGVLGFSVVSDGDAANGRNRLQWLTPSGVTATDLVHIRYNEGATCTPPALGSGSGPILVLADPGNTQRYVHSPLVLDRQYCYSIWIESPASVFSARQEMSARPFNAAAPGKVKWKHFVGTTALAAPTVGFDAVVGVSNNTFVHAMERDPNSLTKGEWPASWKPIGLGAIAQHRSPIVPIAGVSRAFIATQDGRVHAIDTANGNFLWSTQLPEGAAQGAPAGIFTAWGGAGDYVLVGTSAGSNNHFYALDPFTGAVIDAFPNPGVPAEAALGSLGPIYGAAAVDYASSRVYFASRRGGANRSLWCLDLGPASDALRLGWSRDLGVDVDGSPVLHGGRVYVVDNGPVAWSIPANTGLGGYTRPLGGAAVPGFLFPDRRNNDLYVATSSQVHGLTDTGSALNNKWTPILSLTNPSTVLLRPGTNELYVGARSYAGNASLVRIDTATGLVASQVTLEAGALGIGAPSLDNVFEVIHVGSEAGILYAVELPF